MTDFQSQFLTKEKSFVGNLQKDGTLEHELSIWVHLSLVECLHAGVIQTSTSFLLRVTCLRAFQKSNLCQTKTVIQFIFRFMRMCFVKHGKTPLLVRSLQKEQLSIIMSGYC